MSDDAIYKMPPAKDNPALPDEPVSRPGFATGTNDDRPPELEQRMEQLENEPDKTGTGQEKPRPYGLQGQDEGPLGEGGQLRGPDAGGGGSS